MPIKAMRTLLYVSLVSVVALGTTTCGGEGGGGSGGPERPEARAPEIGVTPPDNRAPVVASRLSNGTVRQEGGNLRYPQIVKAFSDPDGDQLTITASSSDERFATVQLWGDDLIVIGKEASATGAVTITVTARDPAGLSVSQSFAVRVGLTNNRPPVVSRSLKDGTVRQGGGNLRYPRISQAFSDPDGDQLTITASSSDPRFATVQMSGDDLIVIGKVASATDAVRITVTARDSAGLSVSQSFAVRVGLTNNRPPVVARRLEDGTVQRGDQLRYPRISEAFSDPDGNRWLYLTVGSSDERFAIARLADNSGDLIVTGIQALATGAVTITVTAHDWPHSVSQSFAVRVVPRRNKAPVVARYLYDAWVELPRLVYLYKVKPGEPIRENTKGYTKGNYEFKYPRISEAFSDPDGDQLTITASSSDPRLVTVRLTHDSPVRLFRDDLIVTGKEGFNAMDVVKITVTARDPEGLSVSQTFFIRARVPRGADWGAITVGHRYPGCDITNYGSSFGPAPTRRYGLDNRRDTAEQAEKDAIEMCESWNKGSGGMGKQGCSVNVRAWRNGCGAYAKSKG